MMAILLFINNKLFANKLTLNMTKTDFILLGSRQRVSTLTELPTLAIPDFQVSQVITAKSVGVTINDKLRWSGHNEKQRKVLLTLGYKTNKSPCPSFNISNSDTATMTFATLFGGNVGYLY